MGKEDNGEGGDADRLTLKGMRKARDKGLRGVGGYEIPALRYLGLDVMMSPTSSREPWCSLPVHIIGSGVGRLLSGKKRVLDTRVDPRLRVLVGVGPSKATHEAALQPP